MRMWRQRSRVAAEAELLELAIVELPERRHPAPVARLRYTSLVGRRRSADGDGPGEVEPRASYVDDGLLRTAADFMASLAKYARRIDSAASRRCRSVAWAKRSGSSFVNQ